MRLIFAALFCLLPFSAHANCGGTDLRTLFSDTAQANLNAASQNTPFGQGNHWLAQKGTRNIHVIGTMHVHDQRLSAPLERLRPIIEAADLVLLEATPVEEQALQKALTERPELLFLGEGATLNEMMPAEQWEQLVGAVAKLGIPADVAAKFQPWYLSLLMSIPTCAIIEMAGGAKGLDKMVIEIAEADQAPMRALEPYDTLFQLFKDLPLEEQVGMLSFSVLNNDAAENIFFTMKESYFDENPAEIWETSRQLSYQMLDLPDAGIDAMFTGLRDLLLSKRNRAWMPVINAAPENNIVVAVGAAHLMGETGVLKLLEEQGYHLTRQPF